VAQPEPGFEPNLISRERLENSCAVTELSTGSSNVLKLEILHHHIKYYLEHFMELLHLNCTGTQNEYRHLFQSKSVTDHN
jgi:hypothetical protein